MKNQAAPAMHSQSGSVLVLILIFIGLFAALSYTMSRGTDNGINHVKNSTADLIASEMIDYGQRVQNAVKMLFINGCTDNTISFESPETVGETAWGGGTLYNNTASPTDKSCHVFYPNGGGLKFAPMPETSRIAGYTPTAGLYRDAYRYFFGATVNFATSATAGTNPEITMWATHITNEVCDKINQKLSITGSNTNVPMVPINGSLSYTGTASYNNFLQVGSSTSADLMNTKMGCIKATDPRDDAGFSGGNSFYAVLYLRQ